MTQGAKETVCWRITEEGIDYTFRLYSKWEEIQDEKFHELRKTYLKAAE